MKKLLTLFLVLAHILLWKTTEKSKTIYPYLPPLIHSSQMSIPTIGQPQLPPRLFLPQIQRLTARPCPSCAEKERFVFTKLEKAKNIRYRMQEQVTELLQALPPDFMEQAIENRVVNDKKMGEISAWRRLQSQR